MKIHAQLVCCSFLIVAMFGCTKKTETSTDSAPATNAPAAPAASAPAASTNTNNPAAEAAAKAAAAEWAMRQDEIKNDPNGEWAISATASSTYSDAKGMESYSANQATGAPNVAKYADDGMAWTSKTANGGIEWLDLKYPKPVHASEVRVRESCGSGAVIKVEIFDEKGTAHAVWQGNDPTTELNYLIVKVPKTDYKTDRVKVTLATNVVEGWNEIDAVQLVGTE